MPHNTDSQQDRFEMFYEHLKMIGGEVALQLLTQYGEKIPSNNVWVDTESDTELAIQFTTADKLVENNTVDNISRCYVSCAVNTYGNAVNDKGNRTRKKSNVLAAKFVTIDVDTYLSIDIVDLLVEKLRPTSVVITSERAENEELVVKTHWYWKLSEPTDDLDTYDFLCKLVCHKLEDTLCILTDTERLEHCKLVDEGASGRSAFLRLPGFWHNKIEGQKTLTHTYHYNNMWVEDIDLWLTEVWQIDEEFVEAIKNLPGRRERLTYDPTNHEPLTELEYLGDIEGHDLIAEGRNASLFSYCLHILYRKKRLSLEDAEKTLLEVNATKHLRPLDDYEVLSIASSAYTTFKAGQDWYAEKQSKTAIDAKERVAQVIASGENPLPPLPHMRHIEQLAEYYDVDNNFTGTYTMTHKDWERGKTTDSSIVQRFIERWGKYVKFVSVVDSSAKPDTYYYSPNTGKWCLDPLLVEGLLRILISQIDPRDIYLEFPNKDKSFTLSIASAKKWILSKLKTAGLDEALRELKTRPELRLSRDVFDQQKHLINMNTYTFDTRAQKCMPHSSDNFFTKGMDTSVEFDEELVQQNLSLNKNKESWQLNKFTRFIIQICKGDTDLANYLQKMFGYAFLAPDKNLQELFFCTGVGDNGKSVLIETMEEVFRGLTAQIDSSVLASGKTELSNAAMSSLAQTKGTKVVFVSELEDGITWRSSVVKKLTGDSSIVVKRSHKDTEAMTIDYAIIVVGNNKPKFAETNGSNHSMWRRLTVIPFHFKVSAEEKNYNLKQELLAEKENIFHWVVSGYKKFLAEGLKPVSAMKEEKDEYREEEGDINSEGFIKNFLTTYFQPFDKETEFNGFGTADGELFKEIPYTHKETSDKTFSPGVLVFKAYNHYLKDLDAPNPTANNSRKFYNLLKETPGIVTKLYPTRTGMKLFLNISIKPEYVQWLMDIEKAKEIKSNVVDLSEKLKQFGYNKQR